MIRTLLLTATILASGPALASQPGEAATGPQTEHVAAPINLEQKKPSAAADNTTPSAYSPVPMAVLTYQVFEDTIDHADLAECPPRLAHEGRFCRVVLHNGALHIFAFKEDGDQPLQAVMSYPIDDIRLPE